MVDILIVMSVHVVRLHGEAGYIYDEVTIAGVLSGSV